MAVERVAGVVEIDVLRQLYGQVVLGHRHDAAIGAMDDRDRTAPIALARHAPVAQPVGDRSLAAARLFEPLADRPLRGGDREPVHEVRVEEGAVLDKSGIADREMRRVLARRQHHGNDRQPVFAGEIEIALIVRRAAENRAGAVFHQHEIRDIDRHLAAGIERMDGVERDTVAALVGRFDDRFAGAKPVAFGDELGEIRVRGGEALRQLVVRRQRQKRGAVKRVRPRREHFDRLVDCLIDRLSGPGDRKQHPGAFRAADPFFLHQPHPLRPAVERLECVEQLVAERGDAQKPLGQEPLLDDRPGAPAAPVDHLLVGQHGIFGRVPIDPGFLAVGEVRREEVEKHLLFVAVIFRMAGRDLARPVIGKAHALQLAAHRRDIFAGPGCRVDIAGDRRILRRQPESVPSHRVQHVEALRPAVAGNQIAHRVVADMPDMELARRIREHFKHIIFRARRVLTRLDTSAFMPLALPFRYVFPEIVTRHACSRSGAPALMWLALPPRYYPRYYPGYYMVAR